MPDLTLMLIAAAIMFLAAVIQGTIGFGLSALSVPLLTLLDPVLTPIPQIMLGIALAIAMAIRERPSIDFDGVRWVLAGRAAGAFLGAWLLGLMTERTGSIVIGAVVVAAAILLGAGWSIHRSRATELVVGVVSGTSAVVSGVGGPPLALLFSGTEGPVTRATLSTIFMVGQSLSIIALTVTGRTTTLDLRIAAYLVLPLLAGFSVSSRVHNRVSGPRLRTSIIVVSGVAGAMLLVQSI